MHSRSQNEKDVTHDTALSELVSMSACVFIGFKKQFYPSLAAYELDWLKNNFCILLKNKN